MITLQLDLTDKATPALRQLLADVKPGGGLGLVMGRALADTLKSHFRARNSSQPNKLGGKRTNFWTAVAGTVQNPVVATGEVSVAVSHPHIAQKVFGGRIVPTNKKALAIPVHAKAHGVTARDMPNLAFIFGKKGKPGTVGYLVEGQLHTILRGKRKGQQVMQAKPGGAMMYVLRKWVDQQTDPLALPETSVMLDEVAKAAKSFLNRPGKA